MTERKRKREGGPIEKAERRTRKKKKKIERKARKER